MFKPLHDYILIEKPLTEEKTQSGLFIPDSARERSVTAKVLAVGPGLRTKKGIKPIKVAPGDNILITKFLGQEFKVDGKEVILIKEENIVAKIS